MPQRYRLEAGKCQDCGAVHYPPRVVCRDCRSQSIETIRLRQIKNMMATLLLSQGVPMIVAGDECRRTQRGNNNAYCQDNPISWFDWKLVDKHEDLRRFFQALVRFRIDEPTVRQEDFLTGRPVRPGGLPDVSWYSARGGPVDWSRNTHSLVCLLGAVPREARHAPPHHHVLLLCHAGVRSREFRLPALARELPWRLFIDTAALSPKDVYPKLDGPPPPEKGVVPLEARSLVCYVAADV
jgi:glycogen operon protein